jgi:two-component system LytT family response regulator
MMSRRPPHGARVLRARDRTLRVVGEYGDGRSRARRDPSRKPPHLLFLDIQMDSMTASRWRARLTRENLPFIVFVTAYDHYALEAFEVCAVDYLLKPFDDARFRDTVARVRRARRGRGLRPPATRCAVLLAAGARRAQRAMGSPRMLAEVRQPHAYARCRRQVELVEGTATTSNSASAASSSCAQHAAAGRSIARQQQPMLRISRSCLVNVNYVRELSRTPRGDFIFVLACGTTVTSSEGHRDCPAAPVRGS